MAEALGLWQGRGIEIEYMVLDPKDGRVLARAEDVLRAAATAADSGIDAVDWGAVGLSNELVAHLVELKTNHPTDDLATMAGAIETARLRLSALAADLGLVLCGGGCHPGMDPTVETVLWPHGQRAIYHTFDRIFDCRRHGWANLQSCQLNCSFADDAEFADLHRAVRLVLPLVPAIAAASPWQEGQHGGWLCHRVREYAANADRVPAVVGGLIPELAATRRAYSRLVYEPLAEALRALQADDVLEPEWTDARAAIPRWERMAVELRLADTQECPAQDMAIAALELGVLRGLVEERWSTSEDQQRWSVPVLRRLCLDAARRGFAAEIHDPALLAAYGWEGGDRCRLGDLWADIRTRVEAEGLLPEGDWEPALDRIINHGSLAERLVDRFGHELDAMGVRAVMERLGAAFASGEAI